MSFLHKPSRNSIELKPLFEARPRSENLYEEFSENKTLYQVLAQALQRLDTEEGQNVEVSNILAVRDTKKFYMKYICLFYKNAKTQMMKKS